MLEGGTVMNAVMNQTIAGYEIIRELGQGGMAIVYLARQMNLDREVALKVMNPAQIGGGGDVKFRERFAREGKLASQLVHPHIVRTYDAGEEDGFSFIAMEYLEGGCLQDKIGTDISPLRAVQITKAIASALGYAHEQHVLHRDIKPHNILFRDDGSAVLTDFGIAKPMDGNAMAAQGLTVQGLAMGTPAYMSPEQIHSKAVDGRADLYSLGIVFYEMLVGRRPFDAPTAMSVVLMQLSDPVPYLPPHYAFAQKVLDKILAKNPNDRYQTAAEFIEALKTLEPAAAQAPTASNAATVTQLSGDQVSQMAKARGASNTPMLQPARRKSYKAALLGVLGIAALLVLLGGVGFWVFAPDARHDPVADLLSRAQVALREGRVDQPSGNNALELYRKTLQLDAGSLPGREGLRAVVTYYRQQAEQEQRLGDLDAALVWVQKALQVLPLQQDLQQLQTALEQERTARQAQGRTEQEVLDLLEQARDDFAAGRLVEPAGKNAAEKYQAVLRARPNNAEARLGLQQIAGEYARNARQQAAQGNIQRALALVDSGLSLVADDAELLKLRQELAQQAGQRRNSR